MKQFIKTTIQDFLNENQGRFDDEYDFSKHNFNIGDCGIYAISLHKLYGYPLYAMRGKFLELEWGGKREWDYEYCHIMIKLPNGNYMDSDGEQTKQEMISRATFTEDVKKVEIVKITEKEAINIFSCENQEDDIQKVMKHIKNKISESKNIIKIKDNIYKILEETPDEGDLVLLPDMTTGILGDIKPNGLTFTDGVDGKTFTSFLHISKYKKIKKI